MTIARDLSGQRSKYSTLQQPVPTNTTKKKSQVRYPFWFGGSASCFAASVTHPLDLVKVRLQTAGQNAPSKKMLGTFVHVVKCDGFLGLYSGLSASLLRQLTYSTTRFGVYEHLKTLLPPSPSNKPPSTPTLVLLASASGLLGGVAGNPADVLNVRMQHDASLPEAQRLNYKSAVHGLVRMVREEGPASLFRGVWPNALRASLMTASQLASYDVFKDLLVSKVGMGEEKLQTHFSASLMAGFVATTVCSPVDVIKTRIMSEKKVDGDKKGSGGGRGGIRTVLVDLYRKEGAMWMWRGWLPSFVRLGPHTIATFLFLEQHKKIYRRWKARD